MIKKISAMNFTPSLGQRDISLIVLHTAECQFIQGAAERVARYFADPDNAPMASAHYVVDNTTVVQCVDDNDVAWHAPGANRNGIGIEHAGYANYDSDKWDSDYAHRMLELSATLCAELCSRHDIPVRLLRPSDLILGNKGITTHAIVSATYKKSDHWDPGPDFPILTYVDMVFDKVRVKTGGAE